jgi:hypothetical protein
VREDGWRLAGGGWRVDGAIYQACNNCLEEKSKKSKHGKRDKGQTILMGEEDKDS